jgi:signal transduction histidine kinase
MERHYRALSRTTRAILRIRDERALCQEVCDIARAFGDFALAWIGFETGDGRALEVVARAGPAQGCLDGTELLTGGDTPAGRGPAATAARQGVAQVVNSLCEGSRMEPWRVRAGRFGIGSAASLPVFRSGRAAGSLNLYSADPRFFGPDSLALLGEIAGCLSFALDDLDREQALERLNLELEERIQRRTALLEAALGELDAFSYSVSHDLRAPLRGIDGFSQALQEECGGQLSADGRHYLQRVRAGTQRMGRLIDDLLKLSQVSRSALNRQPLDLTAMAWTLLQELGRAEPGRRVALQVAPGLEADGDPGLIRVALGNLLGNAWKYTAKVPEGRIEFLLEPLPGGGAFCVRDNGAGFDMAYAGKLFTAFQRLHSAAEFDGTGIGLALVQRIIHRHGGRVWAQGAVGQGASFHFTLPGEP